MSTFASPSLFAVSIIARLPLAMLAIGVLVHVEHRTGSFALAGLAGGILAIAQGVGGPLLGRLVDHHGQTLVLLAGATVTATGLAALATQASTPALLAAAALTGFATPPVAACVRALMPALVRDPAKLQGAYAIDSAAVELTWISGPPLVLMLGAAAGTDVALLGTGVVMLAFTALFAAAPASRRWRPEARRAAAGAMRTPGVQTLALVFTGAGLLFGATEVALTAAAGAHGSTAAAGPLLGLWGAGGFVGGVVAARTGAAARTGTGVALLLAGLAAAHASLALLTGSTLALGAGAVLAGSLIAPTCASAYALVERVAAGGTVTEAFAWMATAVAVGTAGGAAAAGAIVEAAGPEPAILLAGLAAAAAAAVAAARTQTVTA